MEDLADNDNEDDNDSEDDSDLDKDLQKAVLEVANKTDDSGFRSSIEDNPKIEVLPHSGMSWTSKAPSYLLGVSTGSSSFLSSSHTVPGSEKVSGASFDDFVNESAGQSGIGELMKGQVLLRDNSMAAELKQLRKLADEQMNITCRFDAKFSRTVFTILQKTQEAFVGTGGISSSMTWPWPWLV